MINGSDPAFPYTHQLNNGDGTDISVFQLGLTKRELFAAMAMQGMLASITCSRWEENVMAGVVPACVEYADALLTELEKSEGK